MNDDGTNPRREAQRFAESAKEREVGLLRELTDFIIDNKKWWLIPLIASLLLVGILVYVGSSGVGQFIYALF